jgi:hypothetical protein
MKESRFCSFNKKLKWLALATGIFFSTIDAVERRPWFGRDLEIEGRASTLVQAYHSVDTTHGSTARPAGDVFISLSASTACQNLAGELELIAADTRHRSFGMDSISLTGRYLWLNDVIGDPVSLTTGATLAKVFKPARRDLGTFHQGGIECEVHAAVGKEFSCQQFWMSRIWGVIGFGFADIGSAWLRANLAWERNWWERHQLRAFVHTLWGLGHNSLNLEIPFRGYGPIRHQSVDTGMRYRYAFDNGFAISLEYAYRVFASNCPQHVNLIMLRLYYPFGLD